MNTSVQWKKLEKALPQISYNDDLNNILSSPYYKISVSIFNCLTSNMLENGAIYDQLDSSSLDHQYHMSNYSFTAITLNKLHKEDFYYEKAYSSLEYYLNIAYDIKKGSIDFNNFPILLSYLVSDPNRYKELLLKYISRMPHYASITKHFHGNNFITLRAVNHLLRYSILNKISDLKSSEHLINYSIGWQLEDGIFYDYPKDLKSSKGIPHLTYHAKISFITLLYGLISKNSFIIDKAIKGFISLCKLVANDGEAFYYGRTNNALYGYVCAILGLRIAAEITENQTSE